jgi:hypothetical protein
MDWMNAVNDIIGRYTGAPAGAAVADPHEDFQQVAKAAPQNVVASGLSEMFRSDRTPSFAEMVGKLFGQSNPNQRAGLLNQLLGAAGGAGALGSLPGGLAGMLGGGNVSPQQAATISPDQVQQIAAHTEKHDPSVVDKVSSFYSQHPDVMKAVGGLALSIALQHMMRRH